MRAGIRMRTPPRRCEALSHIDAVIAGHRRTRVVLQNVLAPICRRARRQALARRKKRMRRMAARDLALALTLTSSPKMPREGTPKCRVGCRVQRDGHDVFGGCWIGHDVRSRQAVGSNDGL